MKMTTIALAALLLAAPVRAQTNISGDWDMTIQSQQGTNSVRVTFKQDGDRISGIFKSPLGELPFQDGTLTENDLTFAFSLPIQGQPLDITMTGKVDGSSMTGKAQFGGFGEGDWTAKKVEATTADAAVAPAGDATLVPDPAAVPAPDAAPAPMPVETVAASATTTPATGLSGRWDVTVKTQMGEVPVEASFVESAGKVTGSLVGPAGPVDVSGTFDGNAIKLSFTARTPQGDIPVEMSGELSGDTIVNGKAEFGGMGQGEWTAKRKQ